MNQEEATQLDVELMGPEYAFVTEQLMELAGLACALTIERVYPISSSSRPHRVLVIMGPGNKYLSLLRPFSDSCL